ncbi:MAG: EutN/CcmL family microcompartment protein [Acidobacteria bacterium]|nr:EutN/CcmL family microcompartment protein [Acidobacteriota bacterium]
MILARVIAPVVASEKHGFFEGRKLLLVKELLPGGGLGPRTLVALDGVNSGVGDQVLVAKNGGAVDDVVGLKDCPANVVIVAHVDQVRFAAD